MQKPEDALLLTQRLVKLAPKSATSHELSAEIHASLRSFDTATHHAHLAKKLDNGNADRLTAMGHVFQKCAQFQVAEDCIRSALLIEPSHLKARLILTELLISKGRTSEAATMCREIFIEAPFNFPNFLNWGRLGKAKANDGMYIPNPVPQP